MMQVLYGGNGIRKDDLGIVSKVPEAEQCGWLKDKYGLSWQIVPANMNDLMRHRDPNKLANVTQVMLKMKKLDIAELTRAYG